MVCMSIYDKRLYFRGAMSGKWFRVPNLLRAKTIRERGYEVAYLTIREAKELNEAMA